MMRRPSGGATMADLINLRRFKKTKARQDKAILAAHNRVKFGRTAAEKKQSKSAHDQSITFLDGVRREPHPDSTPGAHKPGDK
jgi:hypothetical protein